MQFSKDVYKLWLMDICNKINIYNIYLYKIIYIYIIYLSIQNAQTMQPESLNYKDLTFGRLILN